MTDGLKALAAETLKVRVDLAETQSEWLQQCGPCDLGMPEYGCTHPGGDYRPVMLGLVREIEALRRVVDLLPDHHRQVLAEAARRYFGLVADVEQLTEWLAAHGLPMTTAAGQAVWAVARDLRELAATVPETGPSGRVAAETEDPDA